MLDEVRIYFSQQIVQDGLFMELNEAADFFKKIVTQCPNLKGLNFLVMIPEPTLPLISKGYEVIIRKDGKVVDKQTDQTIHTLALEKNLEVIVSTNIIAIYTPVKENKGML
jgi:hypothetical protein